MKSTTNDHFVVVQRRRLTALKCCVLLVFGSAIISFNHPNVARKIVAIADKSKGLHRYRVFRDDIADLEMTHSRFDIKSINLIGERHCGTKFMTKHLQDCFGDQVEVLNRYTRWKHWFQYDDRDSDKKSHKVLKSRNYHPTNSSIVVAMCKLNYCI